MGEARRCFRYVVPGSLFVVETILFLLPLSPKWTLHQVRCLLTSANSEIGAAVAALLVSGVTRTGISGNRPKFIAHLTRGTPHLFCLFAEVPRANLPFDYQTATTDENSPCTRYRGPIRSGRNGTNSSGSIHRKGATLIEDVLRKVPGDAAVVVQRDRAQVIDAAALERGNGGVLVDTAMVVENHRAVIENTAPLAAAGVVVDTAMVVQGQHSTGDEDGAVSSSVKADDAPVVQGHDRVLATDAAALPPSEVADDTGVVQGQGAAKCLNAGPVFGLVAAHSAVFQDQSTAGVENAAAWIRSAGSVVADDAVSNDHCAIKARDPAALFGDVVADAAVDQLKRAVIGGDAAATTAAAVVAVDSTVPQDQSTAGIGNATTTGSAVVAARSAAFQDQSTAV